MAYDNPSGLIAASLMLELLAVTCVGLRFLSRYRLKGGILISDWLILAAAVFATGLTVLEIYGRWILKAVILQSRVFMMDLCRLLLDIVRNCCKSARLSTENHFIRSSSQCRSKNKNHRGV
jgi:hypothetical protein